MVSNWANIETEKLNSIFCSKNGTSMILLVHNSSIWIENFQTQNVLNLKGNFLDHFRTLRRSLVLERIYVFILPPEIVLSRVESVSCGQITNPTRKFPIKRIKHKLNGRIEFMFYFIVTSDNYLLDADLV